MNCKSGIDIGSNHCRKAIKRLASSRSIVPDSTCKRSGSANGLSAESSYTRAELKNTSAVF